MQTRSTTLFFPTRQSLNLFENPPHAISELVRVLPAGHPLTALEDITGSDDPRTMSAGGRVHDELFGDGYARWERDSGEKFPDWRELFYSNWSCDGGYFIHHVPREVHDQFGRPKWPVVRLHHMFPNAKALKLGTF